MADEGGEDEVAHHRHPQGAERRQPQACPDPALHAEPVHAEPDDRQRSRLPDAQRQERRSEGESRRPQTADSDALPAPLTDDQIAKMDFTTAMREWSTRKKYVQTHPKLDAGDKTRLDDEVTKTKARMDEAKKAASEGGAK